MKMLQKYSEGKCEKKSSKMRREFNEMQMAKRQRKENGACRKWEKWVKGDSWCKGHNRVPNSNACLSLSRQNGLIGRRQKGAN